MKALILAGGTGSRLRPLTYTGAKQLIPVANKPTIFYGIEAIVKAGIKDIGIIVGETKEDIVAGVGDGKRWKVKITYIDQDAPLGLAHAVKTAKSYLKNEPFIMYLGDNILRDGVAEFVKEFNKKKPNSLILLTPVPNPHLFGIAELDKKDKVKKLVEKPKKPKSNLALVGVYLFDKNIFKAVDNIKPSWRNELEITDAIQWLIDKKYKVESFKVNGWWKDTGNAQDLLEANQLILETARNDIKGKIDETSSVTGRIQLGKGSIIKESTLRGPIVIGENCRIENSYIGPFSSIGNSVVVKHSEIEHSIIMEDSIISKIPKRIDQSVIGRGVKINYKEKKPRTNRFVLGDNSQITLA